MSKSDFRPGDWYCPNTLCRMHVYSANMQCKKCGTARPFDSQLPVVDGKVDPRTGFRPGDWMCPNPACRNHVYSANASCKKCGTRKPDEGAQYNAGYSSAAYTSSPGTGAPVGGRPGDWTCPNPVCRDLVFSFNTNCRKCGTAKPDESQYGTAASFADWMCSNPLCGSLVTGSHQFCGKCGTAKLTQNVAQAVLGSVGTGFADPAYASGLSGTGYYDPASASSYFSGMPFGERNDPSASIHGFRQKYPGGYDGDGATAYHAGGGPGGGGGGYSAAGPSGRPGGPGAVSKAGFRPGDWWCPTCGNHVFSFNHVCKKCNTTKPDDAGPHGGGGGGGPHAPVAAANPAAAASIAKTGFRPGDWICPNPSCQNHIYSFNDSCKKCGSVRPELGGFSGVSVGTGVGRGGGGGYAKPGRPAAGPSGVGSADGSSGGGSGEDKAGPAGSLRPGDWWCPNPDCRDHVYMCRDTCRRCGASRPQESGGAGAAGAASDVNRLIYASADDLSDLEDAGCLLLTLPPDGDLSSGALGSLSRRCSSMGVDLESLIRAIDPSQHGRAFQCGVVLYRVPIPDELLRDQTRPLPFSNLFLFHFPPACNKAIVQEMYINLRELLAEMTSTGGAPAKPVKRITSTCLGRHAGLTRVEVLAELFYFLQCSASLGQDLSWKLYLRDPALAKTLQGQVALKKPPTIVRSPLHNSHPELATQLSSIIEFIDPDAKYHVFRVCMLDLQRACSTVDSDRDAFPVCIGAMRSFEALIRVLAPLAAGEQHLAVTPESIRALLAKGVFVQHLLPDLDEIHRLGIKYAYLGLPKPSDAPAAAGPAGPGGPGGGSPRSHSFAPPTVKDSEAVVRAVLRIFSDPRQRSILVQKKVMTLLASDPSTASTNATGGATGGGGGSAASGRPSPGEGGFRDKSKSNFRPGDWMCPTCGNHVYSFNHVCKKCGTGRPGEGGGPGGGGRGGHHGGGYGPGAGGYGAGVPYFDITGGGGGGGGSYSYPTWPDSSHESKKQKIWN